MKTPVLISLLLISLALKSQTIFPDNGLWYQKYHSIAWGHGGEVLWDITEYSNYAVNGDLIVNDKRYLKLYNYNVFEGYIYVDSLKVYFGVNIDSLRLLYDYGLNVGDTFQFYGPDYPYGYSQLNLQVISTDSLMIGDENRKRITFSNFSGYGAGPVWIQGIGDVNFGGIELDYSYVAWYANSTTLLCFSEGGVNIYGNCVTSVPFIGMVPLVSPNPADGLVILNLQQFAKPVCIQLLSADGRMVIQQETGESSLKIDLPEEGKGMYFLVVTDKYKRETAKIIFH
ncbi:MAG: T9SS type A sorting domain-containing protein [Bacteroidota bacterium]